MTKQEMLKILRLLSAMESASLVSKISLPDYLIDAAIKMSLQELGASKAIITDEAPNQNSTQTQGSP